MSRLLALGVGLLAAAVILAAMPAHADDTPQPLVDVALDPGHSRADLGAVGGGLYEYRLTLDLATRTRAFLQAAGLSVRLTHEDDLPLTTMVDPDLAERTRIEQQARLAVARPARVFVSLHLNGGPPTLRGTETYYNPERDPTSPAGDRPLAEALQRDVLAALADQGYASLDRGAKSDLRAGKPYGHFFSLRGPMPSALVESLFLSNPREAALLGDDGVREAIARGCAQGILEYLASAGG